MTPERNRHDRVVLIGLLVLAAIVGLSLAVFIVLGQGLAD